MIYAKAIIKRILGSFSAITIFSFLLIFLVRIIIEFNNYVKEIERWENNTWIEPNDEIFWDSLDYNVERLLNESHGNSENRLVRLEELGTNHSSRIGLVEDIYFDNSRAFYELLPIDEDKQPLTSISDRELQYYDDVFTQIIKELDLQREDRYTNELTKVFGISELIAQNFKWVNVGISWIYFYSNENGLFSIYPANNTFDGSNFKAFERPWYKTAYENGKYKDVDFVEASLPNMLNTGDYKCRCGITKSYHDIESNIGSVKTFWKKKRDDDNVLFAIDFILFDEYPDNSGIKEVIEKIPIISDILGYNTEQVSGSETKKSKLTLSNNLGNLGMRFLGEMWLYNLYLALIVGVIMSLIVPLVRVKSFKKFPQFILRDYPSVKEIISLRIAAMFYNPDSDKPYEKSVFEEKLQRMKWYQKLFQKWDMKELSLGILGAGATFENKSRDRYEDMIKENTSSLTDIGTPVRGVEIWEVRESTYKKIKDTKIRTSSKYLGDIQINHMVEGHPEIQIYPDDAQSILKPVQKKLVKQIVPKRIDATRNFYKYSDPIKEEIPRPIHELPGVKNLMEKSLLLSLGRYYYDDLFGVVDRLYENSFIKAVCKKEFVIELFQEDMKSDKNSKEKTKDRWETKPEKTLADHIHKSNILRTGIKVQRIIIFKDDKEKSKFLQEYNEKFRNLVDDEGIHLKYALTEDDKKLKFFREKDFAIITDDKNREMVAMSSLNPKGKSDNIKGYVSWREADIRYCKKAYKYIDTRSFELQP